MDAPPEEVDAPVNVVAKGSAGGNTTTDFSGFDTPEDYIRAMLVETTSDASLLQTPGSFDPSFKQTLSNLTERANALAKADVEDRDPDALQAEISTLETDFDAALSRIQMPGGIYLSVSKMRSLIPAMIAQFPHLKEFDQSDWQNLYAAVLSPIVSIAQDIQSPCEELCERVATTAYLAASAAYTTAIAVCAALGVPVLVGACLATAVAAYLAQVLHVMAERELCIFNCPEECVSNCPEGQ